MQIEVVTGAEAKSLRRWVGRIIPRALLRAILGLAVAAGVVVSLPLLLDVIVGEPQYCDPFYGPAGYCEAPERFEGPRDLLDWLF